MNLLEEAKRRYPIGTKFYPVHVGHAKKSNQYCIVVSNDFKMGTYGDIYALTDVGGLFAYTHDTKHGNTSANRMVYQKENNEWAEIINEMYTPQQCKDQKIAVICHNSKQANKLAMVWDDNCKEYWDVGGNYKHFAIAWVGYKTWQGSNCEDYFQKTHKFTKTIDFSQVKFDDMKIIGYKAPMDLFNGNVKKGDVLKPYDYNDNINSAWYVTSKQNQHFTIPNEIVTKWEEVRAEEKKTIKVGTKQLDVIIHKDGKCECEGKTFLVSDIIRLNNEVKWSFASYLPWETKIEQVKIGCNHLTHEDLQKIIDTYNSLN